MEAAFSISPEFTLGAAVAQRSLDPQQSSRFLDYPAPEIRRVPDRKTLFCQGEAATRVFEVAHGAFMILRQLPGGRRQILDIAAPGRLIGLTADDIHDCSAVALKNSAVREFDRRQIHSMPRNGARLAAALFEEVHRLRDLATALGRKTAMERLAGFLLAVAGADIDAPAELALPVTRQEIADHLGLALETVCRNFTQMKERGLIRTSGNSRLTILDLRALRRVAAGADAFPFFTINS